MNRITLRIITILLLLTFVFACSFPVDKPSPKPETYTVSYHANNADSGNAPVDAASYTSGAAATVLGNTGNLVSSTTPFFIGWTTAADGSGTLYRKGDSIIVNKNIDLYALWSTPRHLTSSFSDAMMSAFNVAITEEYMAIGGWDYNTAPARDEGVVDIYRHTVNGWEYDSTLTSPDPDTYESFGVNVVMENDYLVVSSISTSNKAGGVFVYKKGVDSSWSLDAILEYTGSSEIWNFGVSIDIYNGRISVGAPGTKDKDGVPLGCILTYVLDDTGKWVFEAEILNPLPPFGYDRIMFGVVHCLFKDQLYAGFPMHDGEYASGQIFCFKLNNSGVWEYTDTIKPSDVSPGDDAKFGVPINVSDRFLITSAQNKTVSGKIRGSVYIYERSENSWSLLKTFEGQDGEEFFGNSVAFNKDTLVIGRRGINSKAGKISVYALENDVFTLRGEYTSPSAVAESMFGMCFINSSYIAVTATGNVSQTVRPFVEVLRY